MEKNLKEKNVQNFQEIVLEINIYQMMILLEKNIVIYFYPKDSTPGCTTEGQDFRDNYKSFQKLNTEILEFQGIA